MLTVGDDQHPVGAACASYVHRVSLLSLLTVETYTSEHESSL